MAILEYTPRAAKYEGPIAKAGMAVGVIVDAIIRENDTVPQRFWKDPQKPETIRSIQYVFDVNGGIAMSYRHRASLFPSSKNAKWISAILGEIPQRLDTEELIGKACMVKVDVSENGQYANVKEIFPLYPGVQIPKPSAPYKRAGVEDDDGPVPF